MPKIIQIGKCLLKLQLKMADMFLRHKGWYTRNDSFEVKKHEIWPQETRNIAVSYNVDILTDEYSVLSQCTRLTDGRTDTNRNSIARPCVALHAVARYKAKKNHK